MIKVNFHQKIINLLTKKDFIVQIHGFDKFMLLLNDKLNLGTIIDKEEINNSPIVKNALKYADKYKKQLEELTKDELNLEEQKAVEKLLPSWWNYELEVQKETNDNKKEEIYLKGLKAYPDSHELKGNYAILLGKLNRNKDAEILYKEAIDIEPNNGNLNNNYATLLHKLNRNEEAEIFYKKALEIEPNSAIYNGNYAISLQKLNRYDEAEIFYKKALINEHNHPNSNGNYAQLLLILGKKEEAKNYIENAFSNLTTENDLLVELLFYRLAHYSEYFEQAKKELDTLLEKGIRSIGWDFSRNIEQAKKEGHIDIKLLEEYAKKITNP